MNFLNQYPQVRQVYCLSAPQQNFEASYLPIRKSEGRIYNDELVLKLPKLPPTHLHYQEWKLRWKSTQRLIDYIRRDNINTILDLGCGNGWFTQHIAANTDTQVLGTDINQLELEQAARLFSTQNCRFAYGDVFENIWPEDYFDRIILNSCVQYFPSLTILLKRLLTLAAPEGEIHILDSPIYKTVQKAAAQQRSKNYFTRQSIPEMTAFYHHHCWEELDSFNYQLGYDPASFIPKWRRKILKNDSPFPWIIIQK